MSLLRYSWIISLIIVMFSTNADAADAKKFNQAFMTALKLPHTMSKDCSGSICLAKVQVIGAKWHVTFARNEETGETKRFYCASETTCEEVK